MQGSGTLLRPTVCSLSFTEETSYPSSRLNPVGSSKQANHSCMQVGYGKRFGHEVVSTRDIPFDSTFFRGACREHDDGNEGSLDILTKLAADIEATHSRHHQIEHNEVRFI